MTIPRSIAPPPRAASESPSRHRLLPIGGSDGTLISAAAFVLAAYVFLANSWVNDDAYITFRVVDNFLNGYGLRWNPVERVQVYTHPLWMFLLSLLYPFTGELFYTVVALSFGCALATLAVATRVLTQAQSLLLFGIVLSSKAFVDYAASGLETPLTYLLCVTFVTLFLRADASPTPRQLGVLSLVTALTFVNRIDAVLLLAPALALAAWRVHAAYGVRALRPAVLGLLPAIAWLLFALAYYGFAFPNTYYAKVATGMPVALRVQQGLAYIANSLRFDPLTLAVSVTLLVFAARQRRHALVTLAPGIALSLAYVIWVGGDYMSGRFLAPAFAVAALALASSIRSPQLAAAGLLALSLYNVLWPHVPVKTTAGYQMAWDWRTQNGIKDERGVFHRATNVLFFAPFTARPDYAQVLEGQSLRASGARVIVRPMVGFIGFFAGPDTYIVDVNGLGDPFLARLPVDESLYFEFYASHYFRRVPDGYLESRETGRNALTDPLLRDYFDRLVNVTTGPIWSVGRLRDLLHLNVGSGRHFHTRVAARRPVDVSAPAVHQRFATHVGTRSGEKPSALKSTGEPGFLQMGPRIPLRAGSYRVAWTGSSASNGRIGFVTACHDDCRSILATRAIDTAAAGEGGGADANDDAANDRPGGHDTDGIDDPLAELHFTLPANVLDLEYRFFVHAGMDVTLERIALRSTAPGVGN